MLEICSDFDFLQKIKVLEDKKLDTQKLMKGEVVDFNVPCLTRRFNHLILQRIVLLCKIPFMSIYLMFF